MVTTTEQAWEAFHAPLHQFIRRRVADEATAEDLLQDVFLKIHQYGSSLTMEENHSPFPMHFYGLCCKNLKLIKIMHRLAVKEAFTWKRGAF